MRSMERQLPLYSLQGQALFGDSNVIRIQFDSEKIPVELLTNHPDGAGAEIN